MRGRLCFGVVLLALAAVLGPALAVSAKNTAGAVRVDTINISAYPEVRLGVTVVGEDGRPARGLTRDSFEVEQAGRPTPSLDVVEDRSAGVAMVIAIDTSGSMVDHIGDSRAVALDLLGMLQPEDEVALTTFDERADPVIEALTSDQALVRQSVENLQAFADRNTAFYSGLFQSVRLASESLAAGKTVVVLTDGEEFGDVSASLPEEIKTLALERGVQIHTVYIGTEPPSNLFQEIANITGGLRFDSTAGAASSIAAHVNDTLRSRYVVQFRGSPPDAEDPFDPTEVVLTVKDVSAAQAMFSLCQYNPGPVAWLPQVEPGKKLGKQERLQPEVLCNGDNALQEVRYFIDGDQVETVNAPPFVYQLFTDKMARGDHNVRVDVLLADGAIVGSPQAAFLLSGNAFNPAYLLLFLALAVAILVAFLAMSRRRERLRLATVASNDGGAPALTVAAPLAPAPVASSQGGAAPAAPSLRGARLDVVSGPNQGQSYSISDGALLGRSPSAGVLLSGSSVSREHAQITRRGDTYQLEDLGSTNGTRVNGRRVSEVALAPGDQIEISPYVLRFEL